MSKNNLRTTSAISAVLCLSGFYISPAIAQDQPEAEDQIIVTGTPITQTTSETLVGVSVMDSEELADRLNGSIGETLKSEPGVTSTFFGPGASRPVIRGQGGDRIRILNNGIGSIDAAAASPDHAVAVEPAMAETIEVIRGSGILRFGSSASAGVVNILDGRIPREAPEDGIDGAIRASATSVDEGKEFAGGVDVQLGETDDLDIVLHLEGTWRDAEDYDIPGFAESAQQRALEEEEEHEHEGAEEEHEEEEEVRDTLENSFVESDSVAAGLSFIGEKGFLGFSVKQFNSTYGVPGGHHHHHEEEHEGEEEEHEEEEEGDISIELEQTRYDLNGELQLDWANFQQFNLYAGYADYEHKEIEGSGEVGTTFANEGYEVRAELIQRERDNWRAAYGVQYRDREFSAIGEEAFVPPTTSEQLGIYTFQEVDNGNWHFEAAGRFETTTHQDEVNNIELDFDSVSVSGGIDYHVDDNWRVGGTIFRTERAPTTEELFSNGPHLATNQFEVGDATLDVETATGIEAAIRYFGPRSSLTFNVFHTSYDDYIFLRPTGEIEDELPVYQFTPVDTVFRGYEITGDYVLGDASGFEWVADVTVEHVEAEQDVTGNDNLPLIPPLGILVGLEAENDRLSVRAELDYAAEQTSVSRFELPTDSYTLVNLYTTFTPIADKPNLKIRAGVMNLTDEEARQHASPLKDLLPLPGRNFRIALEKKF